MEPLEALESLLTAPDRAAALRALSPADVEQAMTWLLSRGTELGVVDSGDLLLLLVQRFDLALVDLDAAERYRLAPSITEPGLRDRVSAGAQSILGSPPTPSLADALVRRTRIAARRMANRGEAREDAAVVEAAVGADSRLRCKYCGYWFRFDDVRSALRDAIAIDQIAFAPDFHKWRNRDQWKPIRTKTNRGEAQQWTELEIEHRVPEVVLGDSASDNLTVACRWCNRGKMAYRSYAEAIPGVLAVSLGKLHESWATMHVARAFYAVVSRRGSCASCGKGPADAELGVDVPSGIAGFRRFFEAKTVCYECRLSEDAPSLRAEIPSA